MDSITRRSFLRSVPAGAAALGALTGTPESADAQLVWKTSDWNIAAFRALLKDEAQIKQTFDITQIGEGKFLNNIKNSLNGLRFGFGIPDQQVKIIAALHGPAVMLDYDDYVWNKYGIGAWLKITDPETGAPALRNIFYPSKRAPGRESLSNDPDDPNSVYQDTSIERLQSRGVQFLACHTATEELVRVVVRRNNLSQSPESVVKDFLAHMVPGVLVVASVVAAIALLQAKGDYTYITL